MNNDIQQKQQRKNWAFLIGLFVLSGILYGTALIRMKGLLF